MIDFRYENSRDARVRTSYYILPVLVPSSWTNFYSKSPFELIQLLLKDSKGNERVLRWFNQRDFPTRDRASDVVIRYWKYPRSEVAVIRVYGRVHHDNQTSMLRAKPYHYAPQHASPVCDTPNQSVTRQTMPWHSTLHCMREGYMKQVYLSTSCSSSLSMNYHRLHSTII
jgi:hypothetical protein